MKSIHKIILIIGIMIFSVSLVYAQDNEIEKTMIVKNENAQLSDFTYLIGDSASTILISEISVLYPMQLWLDLQVLKNKGIKKLNVYIDSGGGSAFAGLSYASQLIAAWDDFDITTYAMGAVASAALPIFLAGERRVALPTTLFMVHKSAITKGGTMFSESQEDLRSQSEMINLIEKNYNDIIIKRSNLTLEELLNKSERTTWFTSKQAKEWGMIDEIQ